MGYSYRTTNRRLLIAAAVVLVQAGPARPNELKTDETAARQTAVRVLNAFKPIEAWLDSVPAAAPAAATVRQLVEVTGKRVNLRVGPSLDANVLMVAEQGEVFEYEGQEGDWLEIRIGDDRRAFVAVQFAKLIAAEQRPPPVRTMTLTLKKGYEPQVRQILEQHQADLNELRQLSDHAEAMYRSKYGDAQPDRRNPGHSELYKSLSRIRKYHRVVTSKFNQYSPLVGELKPTARRSAPTRRAMPVRGSVRAGLGVNTATVEVVDASKTETDVTRSEVAADITADLSPSDKLKLNAAHKEEIRFAPSRQTGGSLDYTRKLGSEASVGARVGLDQYVNDANDLTNVDRTEFGVRGSIARSKSFNATADFGVTGASYPKNAPLDYQDTRLKLGAGGEASPKVAWGATFARSLHDLDDNTTVDDNTRSDLSGNVTFRTGQRSSVAILGHSESVAFDDDKNPGNYLRTGVELQGQRRGRDGQSGTWRLGFDAKSHDVITERDYIEFRGEVQSRRALGRNEERTSRLFVNYRNLDGKNNVAYLDYLEGRWDYTNARTGMLWESNTYAQYYLKNGNAERNARVDQFAWFGLILARGQAIVVGPHVAATTELVTVDGSGMGVFESPSNTVRYGVQGRVRLAAAALRIDGQGRFEKTEFYNVDNASSPIRFELQANGIYKVSRAVDATGRLSYYSVGTNNPGTVRTSEIDVLFGVIYNIGRRH